MGVCMSKSFISIPKYSQSASITFVSKRSTVLFCQRARMESYNRRRPCCGFVGHVKAIEREYVSRCNLPTINKYGCKIGVPQLAPHDLRRTYAQLGYEAGVPITQISTLLGHANIATTQKYLDLSLDLETTASDFIPLSGD